MAAPLTRAAVFPKISLYGFVRRVEEMQEEAETARKKLKREKFDHHATKHEMMWVWLAVSCASLPDFFPFAATSTSRSGASSTSSTRRSSGS